MSTCHIIRLTSMYTYGYTESNGWRFAEWKLYDKPAFDPDPSYGVLLGNIVRNLLEALLVLSLMIGVQALMNPTNLYKRESAIVFIVYGAALLTMGRLFYRSSYGPRTDLYKLRVKPTADALKAKCTQPESYGWLYIKAGMLCFDSPRYSIQLNPLEFQFIDDPDSQFFRGELKSLVDGKTKHTIRFMPAGPTWYRSSGLVQLEKIAKQFVGEKVGIEPSVLPPATPDPIYSTKPTPARKLVVSILICGLMLAGATFWTCQFLQYAVPGKAMLFPLALSLVVFVSTVFIRGYLPRLRLNRQTQ